MGSRRVILRGPRGSSSGVRSEVKMTDEEVSSSEELIRLEAKPSPIPPTQPSQGQEEETPDVALHIYRCYFCSRPVDPHRQLCGKTRCLEPPSYPSDFVTNKRDFLKRKREELVDSARYTKRRITELQDRIEDMKRIVSDFETDIKVVSNYAKQWECDMTDAFRILED